MENIKYEVNEGSKSRLPCESAPILPEYEMEKQPIRAEGKDKIFAVIYFLLGYGFVYTFTSWECYRNLSVFTAFYAAVVLIYLLWKGIRPSGESYFWLVIMLAIGIPFAFWSVLYLFQVIALIFVAAYWTLAASGRLLQEGKTSRWIFFDWWNSIAVVPLCNFTCQFSILLGKREEKGEERKENQAFAVLLGVAAAVPALLIILPLLSRADAGFERIIGDFLLYVHQHLMLTLVRILLMVPVAFYLFGLAFGSISGRYTDRIRQKDIEKTGEKVRKIPDMTAGTVLALVCAAYVVFMGIQGKYLFSAFAGIMPEGFTYAEYARRGFFELCQIGAWNMVMLIGAGLLSKTERKKNKVFRVMAVCLSVLTLLLLMTAVSKMGMYIQAYGLTVKRVLTMVFMIWMGIVFTGVIAGQKKEIPLVRICVMTGAVLFCLLCVFPVEHWIDVYNACR